MSLKMVSALKEKAVLKARRKKEDNPLAHGGEDSDAPYRSEID
jgi:hypothetical protein